MTEVHNDIADGFPLHPRGGTYFVPVDGVKTFQKLARVRDAIYPAAKLIVLPIMKTEASRSGLSEGYASHAISQMESWKKKLADWFAAMSDRASVQATIPQG